MDEPAGFLPCHSKAEHCSVHIVSAAMASCRAGVNMRSVPTARDCPLVSHLPYTDYKDLATLGICHVVLNNLVGRLWRMLLGKFHSGNRSDMYIPTTKRKAMTSRGRELVLPAGRAGHAVRAQCMVRSGGMSDVMCMN